MHKHNWKLICHNDGCHDYSSHYSCECGRTKVSHCERGDTDGDPYSAVWMLPRTCARCKAIINNPEIRLPHTVEYFDKDGTFLTRRYP